MAKKVRRVKKKKPIKSTSVYFDQVMVSEPTDPVEIVAEQTLSTSDQFRLDYAYVVKDLRRVFILAISMFALLIIINLIIQYR